MLWFNNKHCTSYMVCCIEHSKTAHIMLLHKIDYWYSHNCSLLQFDLIKSTFDLVVIFDHFKFCHLKFVILFVIIVGVLELSLNFCRVNIRVEICHNGEDDAHHQQQRGKQDVLSPLDEKMSREETQKCYRIRLCLSWPLAMCCETDMTGTCRNSPVWEALQFQPQSAQWSCRQQRSVASLPAALLSCYWGPWRHIKKGMKMK